MALLVYCDSFLLQTTAVTMQFLLRERGEGWQREREREGWEGGQRERERERESAICTHAS